MNGKELYLFQLLEGPNTRLIIPVFQRNYEWKIAQCKQLFDDLVDLHHQKKNSHFFGSCVTIPILDAPIGHLSIIDGQQRLTTMSLLFLALSDLLREGQIHSNNEMRADQIYESYLIDKFSKGDNQIKLINVKNDFEVYRNLLKKGSDPNPSSKLTINYRYFLERILSNEIDADDLFAATQKLQIISVNLGRDDNPQLIFESLNSTGVDLSEGDKVRNFILMGSSPETQERHYERYWLKIEDHTKQDVSGFLRDYLSIKNQRTPTIENVYQTFKDYARLFGAVNSEQLLQDMLRYALLYGLLLDPRTDKLPKQVGESITRLNRFEASVTRPYFMEVLQNAQTLGTQDVGIDNESLTVIFSIIESYIFRRHICEIPSNALNKIFVSLHRDIEQLEGNLNNYAEKLLFILNRKTASGVFPDDKTFTEALGNRSVYLMRAKSLRYLLERLENFDTLETHLVWEKLEDKTYTIEHVMPQALTKNWREHLGTEWETIHSQWVHRLANLTLSAYNPMYSNYPFDMKKKMHNGYLMSGIRMNAEIAQCEKWTVEELEQRNKHLLAMALKLWPYSKSRYRPAEKVLETATLAEDFDLTGRGLARFALDEASYTTTSWADMVKTVISILYTKDPQPLLRIAQERETRKGSSLFLSLEVLDKGDWQKIDDGLYLNKITSTTNKSNLLNLIFDEYGKDKADLVFTLKDLTEKEDDSISFPNVDRKEFWEFALPVLRANTNAFLKHKKTADSWIAYTTGIPGVSINLVANANDFHVDLNIGTTEKEKNDRTFNHLYTFKTVIEDAISYEVSWTNNPKSKSCNISVFNSNIGLKSREDWAEGVNFLSKTFLEVRDVMLPKVHELTSKET